MSEEERQRLHEQIQAMVNRTNNTQNPDREGLSPAELHRLIHYPLAAESWFGIRPQLEDEVVEQMPLMRVLITFLQHLESNSSVKLTARGYLPRKLVQELYMLEECFQSRYQVKPLESESDWPVLEEIHYISKKLGWCKKRNNKLSLTAKGQKILQAPRGDLFGAYVQFHLFKINFCPLFMKLN